MINSVGLFYSKDPCNSSLLTSALYVTLTSNVKTECDDSLHDAGVHINGNAVEEDLPQPASRDDVDVEHAPVDHNRHLFPFIP